MILTENLRGRAILQNILKDQNYAYIKTKK